MPPARSRGTRKQPHPADPDEPRVFIFDCYAHIDLEPIEADIAHADPCKNCGEFQTNTVNRLHVQVPKPPKVWYPFLYFNNQGLINRHGISAHLFRDDIFDLFERENISGVERGPEVVITPRRGEAMQHPAYFIPRLARTLKLDVEQGDPFGRTHTCTRCGLRLGGTMMPPRLIPIWSTWDGSDLFQLRRPHVKCRTLYCSRRIIDLASAERWRHLRFYSIDNHGPFCRASLGVLSDDDTRIKHLNRKWPPSNWYRHSYADERSVRHWLEMYNSLPDRHEQLAVPWFALMDKAEDALPLVTEQFFSLDEDARLRAARVIEAIARHAHAPVPGDLALKAWQSLPSRQRSGRPPVPET